MPTLSEVHRVLALAMPRRTLALTGGFRFPVASDDGNEVWGNSACLQTVQRACPNQVCSLQGSRDVSCDSLAANDLGTGSGWQQSRQNWALLAVVG